MTVICAQISDDCVIHAADSLLTKSTPKDTVIPFKTDHPKIILIPRFKGAISYWGKVKQVPQGEDNYDNADWDALEWIIENAKPNSYAGDEAEKFADSLADTMSYYLADILMNVDKGIGLHFTAYEEIGDSIIPELFLITNYTGFTNTGGYPAGPRIISQRQTYFTLSKDINFKEHHRSDYRQKVQEVLKDKKGYFTYSNGHVLQFCKTAEVIDKNNVPLSDRPLKIVKVMVEEQEQREVNQRRIGAPCYELVVDRAGHCSSSTHPVDKLPAAN